VIDVENYHTNPAAHLPYLITILHDKLERPASNVLPAAATPLHVALLLLCILP
jgi:hypothetical protein